MCMIMISAAGMSRALCLSLSLSLSVCAMLSKEQGITIVAVCLVYDFFIVQKVITIITNLSQLL